MKRKKISKQLRAQILRRDNSKCRMCGRSIDEVSLEVDHIIPMSEGGTDELDNLATLCRDCNRGKSNLKFNNYTKINLIPNDIDKYFKFYKDPKKGRSIKYHLYCDYRISCDNSLKTEEYHHEWIITDTNFDTSSKPSALEDRKKKEEINKFKDIIIKELLKEGKQLILTDEGLIKK